MEKGKRKTSLVVTGERKVADRRSLPRSHQTYTPRACTHDRKRFPGWAQLPNLQSTCRYALCFTTLQISTFKGSGKRTWTQRLVCCSLPISNTKKCRHKWMNAQPVPWFRWHHVLKGDPWPLCWIMLDDVERCVDLQLLLLAFTANQIYALLQRLVFVFLSASHFRLPCNCPLTQNSHDGFLQ